MHICAELLDAVYVINMEKAVARRQRMQAQLEAWGLARKAQFVRGEDGSKMDEQWMYERQTRRTPGWADVSAVVEFSRLTEKFTGKGAFNLFWTREMLPSELGCVHSHVKTWRQIVAEHSKVCS